MRHDPAFSESALDWLGSSARGVALIVGQGSAPLAEAYHRRGHRLMVLDHEPAGVSQLRRRAPGCVPLVGAADALPLRPCMFDAVAVGQGFHTLAPGLALAEFARVLRPGGLLVVTYTVRDDSVPWVRRLVARLRRDDPDAMAGNYGEDSVAALNHSDYFTDVRERTFRRWVPMNRAGLLAMVARTPTAAALDEAARAALLDDVAALYDDAAKPPEPLLLPYRVRCWRAEVDHTDLSAPLSLTEGLQITL